MTLYVGFAILSGLLLWAVIYAHGPWLAKLALIVTVPLYGVFVWHSIEQWKGYPAAAVPPKEAALVAQMVVESEAIYVWLVPPGADEPRAYRLPYSRATHEQAARGQALLGAGVSVGFRRNDGRYEAYVLPPSLPSKDGGP